ncbi:Hsp20 family protein, partial [Bacillus thuringiensis]|nr:Hsp20 family protein [Bacillus thuringiensis]
NISLQRTIPLPANVIYKKMLACLENGFLAIHISKNEVADKHEKKVLFSN